MTDEQKELLKHAYEIVDGAYQYGKTLTVHEMEEVLDDIIAIKDIERKESLLV